MCKHSCGVWEMLPLKFESSKRMAGTASDIINAFITYFAPTALRIHASLTLDKVPGVLPALTLVPQICKPH